MTTIKLKNGSGAPTSGDLVQGEPALDLTNKRLYTENSSGTVIEVGTNPTSITTGTVTADGLTLGSEGDQISIPTSAGFSGVITTGDTIFGNAFEFKNGNGIVLVSDTNDSGATGGVDATLIARGSSATKTALFDVNGDISFYEDTGTTAKFFWDASAESLGIGGSTITDSNLLNIQGSSASVNIGVVFNDTNTSKIFGIQNGGSSLKFFDYTANAERMRIDASGNVGIGTSSPFFTASGRVSLSLNGSNSSILAFGKNGSSENYILADAGGFTIANTSATLPTIFFNNGTERMRIDSSGNLLHGITGVPTGVLLGKQLVSSSPTGSEIIAFREDSSVAVGDKCGALLIGNSDPDGAEDHFVGMWGKASSTNGSQDLHFAAGRSGYEGDSPQMTLSSGGNVGIGTTSTFGRLSINSNGAPASSGNMTTGLTVHNSTAGTAINIGTNDAGAYNYIQSAYVNSAGTARNLAFFAGATRAVDIDASGNLLVGKTSTNVAVDGCRLGSFGAILTRGDGSEPLRVNRTSSDGELIKLDKDGSTVGSIGTASSRIYIGTSDTGLGFSAPSDAVFPVGRIGR
jgi:hypothetical protein